MDGKTSVSSATQTDSALGHDEGKLSSPDMSGLSGTAPEMGGHSTVSQGQPTPTFPLQPLYKELSLAVTDGADLDHSAQPADAPKAGSAKSMQKRSSAQQGSQPAAAQPGAVAVPIQVGKNLSQSCNSSLQQPSSWTRPGMPAPASPFATDEEEDFTFSGSRASEQEAVRSGLPGASSASTQPGTSPGQDSLFALRQRESSVSQEAQQEQWLSSLVADGAPRMGRRNLESADSAYTAMHADRQHQAEQLALQSGTAAAIRTQAASDGGSGAAPDRSQLVSCDGCSDRMRDYSQGSSMMMSPVVGLPVRAIP